MIDCEKCGAKGMVRNQLFRLSPTLGFVGYGILTLGILGLLASVMLIIKMNVDRPERLAELESIVPILTKVQGYWLLGISVQLAIVGLVLSLKRKVWKCTTCGYFFGRL